MFASIVPAQQTLIRTETRQVLVDAVVTDKKGNYVSDLAANDFRVWEDDKEQAIVNCAFEGGNPMAVDSRKRFLMFLFDSGRMRPADVVRARRAAEQFIDANLSPNRQIAVGTFDRVVEVTQNFTFDPQKLKQALDRVESVGATATAWDRRGTLDTSLETAGKSAVGRILMALGALVKSMGTTPGRKSLVLFTPGFEVGRENSAPLSMALKLCNRANVSIYPVDLGSSTPAAGGMPGAEVGSSVKITAPVPGSPEPEATPRGTPGATPDLQASALHRVLETIATDTGGFVTAGGKDLFASIDRIGKELDQYYVLAYSAPSSQDGGCHSLKVKVNRGGTAVRARSAYCSLRSPDLLAGTPIAGRLEARLTDSTPGNLGGFIEAPYFYTAQDEARVNIALEIPAADLNFEKAKTGRMLATVQILGVAYRPDGGVAARFSDSARLDLDKQQLEAMGQRTFHYESQIEMATGEYKLKIVYSAAENKFGKMETPLSIDAYDGKRFTLSALALSNNIRTAPAPAIGSTLAEDQTPLIAEGLLIVPSGSNRFRQSDRAVLYAEAYEAPFGEATPPAVAVILKIKDRKSGAEKDNSGLIRVSGPELWDGTKAKVGLRLPIEKIGPGAYRVELTGYDSAGRKTPVRTTDLDVE
jgi:VWFA-related protein